jgi:hypothetical protein
MYYGTNQAMLSLYEFMVGSTVVQVALATNRSAQEVMPIVESEFQMRAHQTVSRHSVLEIVGASIERVNQTYASMIPIHLTPISPEKPDGDQG